MKQLFLKSIIFISLINLIIASAEGSTVPQLINYQGKLTDKNGKALTGNKKIEFNLYDAAGIEGNKLWGPQIFEEVFLEDGHFNVILGPTDTENRFIADAFNSDNCFVGIKVGDVDVNLSEVTEISPRQRILSVPYAMHAASSIQADNATQADVAKTVQGNGLYVNSNDNVGVGTTTPKKKLEINGTLGFTGGSGPFCIFANSCPNGWIDKGLGGYISNASCPYAQGGKFNEYGWTWCHPRICCNE